MGGAVAAGAWARAFDAHKSMALKASGAKHAPTVDISKCGRARARTPARGCLGK